MNRSESAVLLSFPHRPRGDRPAISRAQLEHAIARGRTLQAQALRKGLARAFRFLLGGYSLRGLRVPGQRQPC